MHGIIIIFRLRLSRLLLSVQVRLTAVLVVQAAAVRGQHAITGTDQLHQSRLPVQLSMGLLLLQLQDLLSMSKSSHADSVHDWLLVVPGTRQLTMVGRPMAS